MAEGPDRRGKSCVVCGRPVAGLDEARLVGGQWFCSPSHLLAAEGRTKRRRPSRGWLGTALVIGAVVALASFIRHPNTTGAPVNIAQALQQLQAEGEAQGTKVLFAGKLTPAARAVAERYMFDEYVRMDCAAANSYYDAHAAAPVGAPCAENLSIFATAGRSYLVRGALGVLRKCGNGLDARVFGFAFKASECYVFTLVGHTNKLSSVTIDGKSRPTWSYTITEDNVWVSDRGGRWRVVYETSGDSETIGIGAPGAHQAERLWSRRMTIR